MMDNTKDYVFIGWNNSIDLALGLRAKIEESKTTKCVIGGNHHDNPPLFLRHDDTINSTVEFQISHCNHFIFLFSKKIESLDEKEYQSISGNLLYELGLARASCKFRNPKVKINVFYIDIDLSTKDKKLVPSDLDGIWAHPISTGNQENKKEEKVIIEEIYEVYSKSRGLFGNPAVKTGFNNKFNLIDDSHFVEHELKIHFSTPSMSDFDLAQAILAYVQSAFCYQDQDFVYDKMKKFQAEMCGINYTSKVYKGLVWSVDFGLNSLKLFCSTRPDESGKKPVMDFALFSELYKKYLTIASSITKDINGEGIHNNLDSLLLDKNTLYEYYLEYIILAQIQEHITFLLLVYISSLDDNEIDIINDFVDIGIRYCKTAIDNFKTIEKESPSDKLFSILLLSYAYKNLSTFYSKKKDADSIKESVNNKKESFKLREELKEYVNDNLSNPLLVDYIEMEYYSQLVDMIEERSNTFEKVSDVITIQNFIKRCEMSRDRRYIMLNTLIENFDTKMNQLKESKKTEKSEEFDSLFNSLFTE